jgi:hypothetical protein
MNSGQDIQIIPRAAVTAGLVAVILIMAALWCPISRAAGDMSTKPEERSVAYQRMGIGDYQNFLKNWDEKRHPVLYALIRTPAQYDALFHPAPVMRDKRPFAPGADIYAREQILVVARVMVASENMNQAFEAERVTEKGRELALHYRFHEPETNATFSVKNHMALRIPRREYQKVTFFENGKRIGELKTAEGQWSVPSLGPEPNQTDASGGK